MFYKEMPNLEALETIVEKSSEEIIVEMLAKIDEVLETGELKDFQKAVDELENYKKLLNS